jgi:hypothetical protein
MGLVRKPGFFTASLGGLRMFGISKGDIVVEPIEFLVELVIRFLVRVAAKGKPEHDGSTFSFAEWLWLAFVFVLVGLLLWWFWRVVSKRILNNKPA